MGHATSSAWAEGILHVLGEFQHFDQIDKLFCGDRIVVNAKVGKENAGCIDFCIQYQSLKIFVADHFREQAVIEIPACNNNCCRNVTHTRI